MSLEDEIEADLIASITSGIPDRGEPKWFHEGDVITTRTVLSSFDYDALLTMLLQKHDINILAQGRLPHYVRIEGNEIVYVGRGDRDEERFAQWCMHVFPHQFVFRDRHATSLRDWLSENCLGQWRTGGYLLEVQSDRDAAVIRVAFPTGRYSKA